MRKNNGTLYSGIKCSIKFPIAYRNLSLTKTSNQNEGEGSITNVAPKNLPNTTWRGKIYKYTSMIDYSKKYTSIEKEFQTSFPGIFIHTSLPSEDYKDTEQLKRRIMSKPTSSTNHNSLIDRVKERLRKGCANILQPIEEYNTHLHIKQLSIIPRKSVNYMKVKGERLISSVISSVKKIKVPEKKRHSVVRKELVNSERKRYSHTPNVSLFTIREKVEKKSKLLNRSNEIVILPRKRMKVKLRRVRKEAKESPTPVIERLKQKSKPVFFTEDPYTFVIIFGNNSQIVKQCMERRTDWKEASESCSIFNFKWQPFSKGFYFDQILTSKKQMINHFEFHHEITTKDLLYKNLAHYSEHTKKNVLDIVPFTFLLNMDEDFLFDLERFIYCFNVIEQAKGVVKVINQKLVDFPILKEKKMYSQCKFKLTETSCAGNNLWILKPTEFNRGRGVSVFNTIDKLKKLLRFYSEGIKNDDPEGQEIDKTRSLMNNSGYLIKSRTFVIQKYIERPLLFDGRKFDIRVWVLVTHDMKVYFFKEGYIRTSCEKYTTDNSAVEKKNIHLTNNAIQKFYEGYGAYEDGNQISFQQFQVTSLN